MSERGDALQRKLRSELFGVFESGWFDNHGDRIAVAWKGLCDDDDPTPAEAADAITTLLEAAEIER